MIAGKQTATLDEWIALPNTVNPTTFVGTISNHPRQADFSAPVQQTSEVVFFDFDNGLLETRNTIYRLGTPALPR